MSATDFLSNGGGLRLGPPTNLFNGVDEAAAIAARDSYFSSNPSNLAAYTANSNLMIRLTYNDAGDAITRYMVRMGGAWIDYSPVVTGLPGEVASLVGVQIGEIPFKQSDGTFAGSNMRVLDDGTVLAPPGFTVESGSVSFGDVLTVSEASGFLAINNHLNNKQYTIVDYNTPRDAASANASLFHLNGAEAVFIAQPIDTTTITANPLITPNYTVQNTARTNALSFRTGAAMSNVRIAISKVSNGVVAKYIPSKQAWEEGFGGLEWTSGDNTFDFNDTPLIFNAGDLVKFEIRATSVSIKGNATSTPYFTATLQTGVFRDVIDDSIYVPSDIKAKLETLISPNKLSKTAIQDVVNTVNGSTGDVVITAASLNAQPLDATLTGLAAVSTNTDTYIYATAPDTFTTGSITAFGRGTLDDVDQAAGRATYGLGDVATRNVDVANGIATLDGSGKLTQMPNKADVGLNNVDNTSDINKPVSTAQSIAIAASITAHNAAIDPHPQYTTTAEASAAAPVQSVAGKTGTVTLNTGDVAEASNLYYTDTRVDTRITAGGYLVKSASSVGGGSAVYQANTAGVISFRSVIGTGIASVTQNANDITINVPAAPVTSVNGQTGAVSLSTTNISEGTNLYYTDARVLTYFNTLGYTVKSINNIGTGANVFSNTTSGVSSLRSILGGGAVTVTQNTNDVTISAPAATVTSVGSVGTGSSVYQSNTSGAVTLRSVIGTGIATVTQNTNDITINVPAPVYPVTSVNSQTGTVVLTTTNIAEGTNLYYTDTRVGNYLATNGYTVKTVATIGGGASLINSTGPAATFRSVIGTGLVTVTQNTNDVTISTPTVVSSTYTPTITNIANIQAVTAAVCMYTQIGTVVTVHGRVNIDPTTNGSTTSIEMTLPVASNLGAVGDLIGVSACNLTTQSGSISANAATDRALMEFQAGSNAARDHTFTYKYRIL